MKSLLSRPRAKVFLPWAVALVIGLAASSLLVWRLGVLNLELELARQGGWERFVTLMQSDTLAEINGGIAARADEELAFIDQATAGALKKKSVTIEPSSIPHVTLGGRGRVEFFSHKIDRPFSELTLVAWVNIRKTESKIRPEFVIAGNEGKISTGLTYSSIKAGKTGRFIGYIGDGSNFVATPPGLPIQPGWWYQLVLSFDGHNLQLFVDGELVALSKRSKFDRVTLGPNFGIYERAGVNGAVSVSEIALFKRAAHAAEIRAYYRAALRQTNRQRRLYDPGGIELPGEPFGIWRADVRNGKVLNLVNGERGATLSNGTLAE